MESSQLHDDFFVTASSISIQNLLTAGLTGSGVFLAELLSIHKNDSFA